MKFEKETILADVMIEIYDKGFEPNNDDFINKITSADFINHIVLLIGERKDYFISTEIVSKEWEYYEFPGFNASCPKVGSNSEDIIGSENELKKEITNGFIKAQAIAIYNDELEEFYISLFCDNI